MGLNPVSIENFPGLDLRADPGDSRAAVDLLNITLEPGRVRTRDGSRVLHAPPTDALFVGLYGDTHVIIGCRGATGVLRAITPAGVTVASSTCNCTETGLSGVAFGTTSASFFYVTDGTTVKQWSGAAWSSPAGFPTNTRVLAPYPNDNRLVSCAANSTVWFSDAGAPTVYGANNFVVMTPGDNEGIQGACTYNNQTFVFKKSKFFVFYGTSADPAGNPVFNFRAVDAGIGMYYSDPQSVCVGSDGVYFIGRDGVYKTTGGPPVCISRALDPFFSVTGSASAFWQGGTLSTSGPYRIGWVTGKLWVSFSTSTGSPSPGVTFIYDPALNAWSAWDVHMGGVVAIRRSGSAGAVVELPLMSEVKSGTGLWQFDPSLPTDEGGAFTTRYRLPFEDYGSPRRKRLRETILEGSGSVNVQWSKDWGALTTGTTLTLGTAPALLTKRQRLAMLGNSFSLQLGHGSGAWAVNRVQANVSDALGGPEITV